jgi:hypothetical protein
MICDICKIYENAAEELETLLQYLKNYIIGIYHTIKEI